MRKRALPFSLTVRDSRSADMLFALKLPCRTVPVTGAVEVSCRVFRSTSALEVSSE